MLQSIYYIILLKGRQHDILLKKIYKGEFNNSKSNVIISMLDEFIRQTEEVISCIVVSRSCRLEFSYCDLV